MKECSCCHKLKDLSCYYSNKRTIDGYQSRCKECMSKARKGEIVVKHYKQHCLQCGSPIIPRNMYCSKECRQLYEWAQRRDFIETTGKVVDHITTNDSVVRKWAKKYLIEKYGYKCMMCGLDEWLGKPVMLICDHIDGDASNINIDNIRLLCPNCNSTLPTFANRNKGKGRGSLGLTK